MAKRVCTQTFATVGALIEEGGQILMVKEVKLGFDNGKWNVPEGWLEVGENPLDAVKREVKEETGYAFEPTAILGIYSIVREDMRGVVDAGLPHAIKITFLGNIDESNVSDLHDDVSETKWFSPEEIEEMGQNTLRNSDIKKIVKDYFSGRRYPLELLSHTVQKSI